MSLTLDQLYSEALRLPAAAQEELAERLVAHLEADIDPAVEQAHLAEVRRRRAEVLAGKVELLAGPDVVAEMRREFGR